jgi:AmmeMemoRadiSam system protein B
MPVSHRVRPPAVAGRFYPAAARALREEVERLLGAAASQDPPAGSPRAVVAPHAGYRYSGAVAARAFAALSHGPVPSRIVLLGPAHRVPLRGLALPGVDALATPLGEVPIDPFGVAAVAGLPQVRTAPQAHDGEHALEVELPFLQVLFPGVRIVPLLVGESEAEAVAEVLDALWDRTETVVVVSSDLSHYLPADDAKRADRATADQICRLAGPLRSEQACGARPLNGLLLAAAERELTGEVLELRDSSWSSGDAASVVGYGAFAFHGGH